MELRLLDYQLELKHTFTIARESTDIQDTLIVELSINGYQGYGEATSNPYYGITIEGMKSELMQLQEPLLEYNFEDPEQFYLWLEQFELSSFALCALDLAANDLWGKIHHKPLYELWGVTLDQIPTTNFTIGIDTIEKMKEKLKEQPWPIYKIKLGTDKDVDIVKSLREETDAIFRVDANCAWTAQQCIEYSKELKDLGVQFIEQPLKADNWEGMQQVKEHSQLPIIADESCIVESDVVKCAPYFDGINIKLTKCGGITPAKRMISQAKSLGLKVMIGCMTESTVGISAIAQLLPYLDYVDMDGALLLAKDIAKGVYIDSNAVIHFPKLGGSGVALL